MENKIATLSGIVILLCTISCSPVLYSTVGQNVPLFKEKGEGLFSAGYASTQDADGLYVQGATSVSDHWAILSSFYYLSKASDTTDNWSGNGSYFELGGGGFGTFGRKGNFIFEVFVGGGFGSINNFRQVTNSTANLKFFKPFLQPSIGLTGKWFEIAFTPRFGIVSYTDHSYTLGTSLDSPAFDALISEEENTFVFEPGLTIRTGYKGLKLQLQYNTTTFSPWEPDEDGNEQNIETECFSIGLSYLLSKRYRAE